MIRTRLGATKLTASQALSRTKASPSSQKSPVFLFSADVLITIFTIAVKLERAGGGYRLFDYRLKLPLSMRLSHVCTYLRGVVLETPSLWNRIDSEVFPSPTIVDAYLTRSCGAHLDVNITPNFVDFSRFKQILPTVGRWRRFSLEGDDGCEQMFEDILNELRTLRAPHLTHLRIGNGCEEIDINSVTPTFSGGTPSLISLDLDTYTFYLPPDLDKVKSLSLYNQARYTPSTNYREFCKILNSMPSLVDLRITGEMATAWPAFRAVKPIGLHLKSLRVSIPDRDDLSEEVPIHYLPSLLMALSTGSLQYFALFNSSEELFDCFLKTLRHGLVSFPNVKWLEWSVDVDEAEEEALGLIVKSFPNVETLSLSYFTNEHTFLQFLARNSNVWPKLQVVNVRDVNIPVLRDLVASRIRSGLPIKEAWVEERRGPEDDACVIWLKKHLELRMGSFDGLPTWHLGWE